MLFHCYPILHAGSSLSMHHLFVSFHSISMHYASYSDCTHSPSCDFHHVPLLGCNMKTSSKHSKYIGHQNSHHLHLSTHWSDASWLCDCRPTNHTFIACLLSRLLPLLPAGWVWNCYPNERNLVAKSRKPKLLSNCMHPVCAVWAEGGQGLICLRLFAQKVRVVFYAHFPGSWAPSLVKSENVLRTITQANTISQDKYTLLVSRPELK